MKMIEFFISRKLLLLVFTAALNHTTPCAVKRARIGLARNGSLGFASMVPRAIMDKSWKLPNIEKVN